LYFRNCLVFNRERQKGASVGHPGPEPVQVYRVQSW
jgi:hypothetical protein